jgi:peptidoglycan hydrolase-like protein with peptidoglycan-binding domain
MMLRMAAMTPPPRFWRCQARRLVSTGLVPAVLLLTMTSAGSLTAAAGTRTPAVPTGLPSAIEELAAYVPANSCTPHARPGTIRLGRLLTSTYPGTTYGTARACGTLPNSEHHDGRAVDWMNSVRDAKQAAQAKAVISWLLATDVRGNPYANARRLGVMYIIWNNKIWGAYAADRGWRAYSSCADHPERSWDTTCHRNHMHISLSWAGAMGRTSFWTRQVAAADFGRCRPADLNWSYGYKQPNPRPCPRFGVVRPPAGASALLKSLTNYSGRFVQVGSKGAIVTAVQKAIKTSATGTYTTATATAMKAWQRRHGVEATGTVSHATWRALLKALAPKSVASP